MRITTLDRAKRRITFITRGVHMPFCFAAATLGEFCQRNHLPALTFDPQGCCHILLDGQLPVTLRSAPDRNRLTLIAQVDAWLPDHPSRAWLENCLSAAMNPLLNDQPGLGWHRDLGLAAFIHLDNELGSVLQLEVALARLAEWIERWREENGASAR
ncbi:CesT family type III secretion system chaperone [Burkholderia ubonensis]|uniref:CesT family type III secretion system chaperone n=1 Tax=Burkholderia ubonensis TaxID=101571 RepID=UPI0012F734D3|nr:CesT family type III secretion system chaperone [Burkholderia ubonensis]